MMHARAHESIGEEFRNLVRGPVLLPGDAEYDEGRRLWNGRFDPRPAAIVRCADAADVAAVLRHARQHAMPVSVRGGGHSYAGHSMADGALAIHLGDMRSVRVDAERRQATVGPGATWGDVDAATQQHGLATTGGTVSTVGVAGYTLGGGTGWLARKYGLGLDNLLSAEVVTADGRVLRASAEEHADLFWAIRGGGGNFGIVTSLEFRLHPVGPEVVMAQAFHPIERAAEALRFYRDFAERVPDEVAVYAFVLRVPPVDPFPSNMHGAPALAMIACHSGDLDAGETALSPVTGFGEPFLAGVQRLPYVALQQAFDAGMPKGLRWYSRAHYLDALPDEAVDTMVRFTAALPGPFTMAYLEREGGAIGRVDPAATAFPHRGARYGLYIFPGWSDPADDAALVQWAREFHAAMTPYASGGVYVNMMDRDETERLPRAYGSNLTRLAELKRVWDPENVFRMNHNIAPIRVGGDDRAASSR